MVNLDAVSYGANPQNLSNIDNLSQYSFVRGNITDTELVQSATTEDGSVNEAMSSESDCLPRV